MVEHGVEVRLFDVRKDDGGERMDGVGGRGAAGGIALAAGGKLLARRFVVEGAEAELLHVVGALCATGSLASRLHRGKQQRDEDSDDGDHHEEFDQRKRGSSASKIAAMKRGGRGARRHGLLPFNACRSDCGCRT